MSDERLDSSQRLNSQGQQGSDALGSTEAGEKVSPLELQLQQRYASSLGQSGGVSLDLSGLALTEFPPLEELAERFPRLRQLNVRRNALQALPDGLARAFPQLVALNVAENALQTLSASSLGALRHLQKLSVARNRLQDLPAAVFAGLEALEELDARGNQIETLTVDEADAQLAGQGLRKLQVLLLTDNRLRSITSEAAALLPSLRVLDLSGNPELQEAPERLRWLHERNLLLHSRAKRRELIARALSVRNAVKQSLAIGSPAPASPKRVK
ncbi:hypothetical protein BBJ28_00007938 [Nothophytophthora sp. Chile5]|nr:hypothetical protein BBJ28_00007938 [Nothophytophthora sp. Chile5]